MLSFPAHVRDNILRLVAALAHACEDSFHGVPADADGHPREPSGVELATTSDSVFLTPAERDVLIRKPQ